MFRRLFAFENAALSKLGVKGSAGQQSYASGMVCRERWNYIDRYGRAILSDFALICPDCNCVLHIGFATIMAYARREELHMAKINANLRPKWIYRLKLHSRFGRGVGQTIRVNPNPRLPFLS